MGFIIRCSSRFSVTWPLRRVAKWLCVYPLIALLLFGRGHAYAEWVSVFVVDNVGMTAYVNPDSVHRQQDLVRLWILYDFKKEQILGKDAYLSSKMQSEFDCAEGRVRMLMVTAFSGNMESGDVVFSDSDEKQWKPVQPRSVENKLWAYACG